MRAHLDLLLGPDRLEMVHTAVGDTEPSARVVVDIGAVSLTQRELHDDPPRPEQLTNAIGHVQDLLDDAVRDLLPDDPTGSSLEWAVLGASGPSVETIAAVEIGLAGPDRSSVDGFVLTRAAAEDVFRTLATERRADRAHNPGLPADEIDTVLGACCIVVAVMRRFQSEDLVVRGATR